MFRLLLAAFLLTGTANGAVSPAFISATAITLGTGTTAFTFANWTATAQTNGILVLTANLYQNPATPSISSVTYAGYSFSRVTSYPTVAATYYGNEVWALTGVPAGTLGNIVMNSDIALQYGGACVAEYSGVDRVVPFPVYGQASSALVATIAITITTQAANSKLINTFSTDGASVTNPANFTVRATSGTTYSKILDASTTAKGQYNATWLSNTDNMFGNTILLELQPPTARGPRSMYLKKNLRMFMFRWLFNPSEAFGAPQNQIHESGRINFQRTKLDEVVRQKNYSDGIREGKIFTPTATRTATPKPNHSPTITPTITKTPNG